MHGDCVATVNPDDDDIQRFVVRRYAYDALRRERRHQIVAAFDNKREFLRSIKSLDDDLQRRRSAGEPVDSQEHYTGVTLEPGHRRQQQAARLLREAIRHGVALSDDMLNQLDLPSNVGLVRLVPVGLTTPPGAEPSSQENAAIASYLRRSVAALLVEVAVTSVAWLSLFLSPPRALGGVAVAVGASGIFWVVYMSVTALHLTADWRNHRVIETPARLVRIGRRSSRPNFAWDAPGRRLRYRRQGVPWKPEVNELAVIRYLPRSGLVLSARSPLDTDPSK
jgi:hypothetical protein